MWAVVLKFLTGVSLKTWLWVAAIAALGGWHLHATHAARVEGVAEATAKFQPKLDTLTADLADTTRGRDDAVSANGTNQATITALRGSVAMCEAGRLADQSAQARAMAERGRAVVAAQASYAKAIADLDAFTAAGRCKAWDDMPACGVIP